MVAYSGERTSTLTNIPLTLNFPSKVRVSIFDLAGREVGFISNDEMSVGEHTLLISRNINGNTLSTGIYICKISVENSNGQFGQSKLMVVQ